MPSDMSPPKSPRPRGRSALLVHAMAQRENRMRAERRDAATRLDERKGDGKAAPATSRGAPSPREPAPRQDDRNRPAPPRPASSVAALNRPKPRETLIAEALAARQRLPEAPAGLDLMVAEALGAKAAYRHLHDGSFDREAALADLIARTQVRLGTAEPAPAAAAAAASGAKPARAAAIEDAMRTHHDRQTVFEELSLRQRATLRAAAEAVVDKRSERG